MTRKALAVCVALGLAVACGEREASPYAAEVDGHPIALETLRRAIETRQETEPRKAIEDLAGEELERLIDERVLLNRAEALGIKVTPQEVEERILLVHGENFALADPAYDEQVRGQMVMERTTLTDLAPNLDVGDQELHEYFERHRAAYDRPERVQIRQIVVGDPQRARELRAKLALGADFAALARENSLAPEAREGGLLPPYAKGDLPEVFDRAFALKAGQPSEVIESPHGYHIFLVVEKIPAQAAELEAVREEILGLLQRQRLAEMRGPWLRDLRRQAKIAVNDRLLEDLK